MPPAATATADRRHHLAAAGGDRPFDSSGPDGDAEEDDVEYEEIEVEEEVEEDEEEGEEEEVEEMDEGESLDSLTDDDVGQDMASNGLEVHLRSSVPEKSASTLRSATLALEGGSHNVEFSSASEARQKGESCVEVEKPQYEKYGFGEPFGDKEEFVPLVERGAPKDGETHNDTSKALSFSGKEMDAAISIREESCNEAYAVSLEAETKKMLPQSEDRNQDPTRLVAPQMRPRSLSPVAELNNGKKRPASICDFFTKGWCIKGNLCRFLHIKVDGNITSPRPEGDIAALAEKSELQAGGGMEDGSERSRSTDFPIAMASSVAYSSSSSLERVLSGDHGKSPRCFGEDHNILSVQRENLSHSNSLEMSESPFHKDTARPLLSSKDVGRENLRQNRPLEDILMHRNGFFPDPRSLARNSSIPSDAYASLPTSGIVSSPIISGLTRSSFSFSPLDKDPIGAQKLPDFVREYRTSGSASLLRSSSPFSGSESGNLSLIDVSGDPLFITGHRTRITTYDWEPSVPFRPSYFTQCLLSSGNMYDPISDSIEQTKVEDGFSKFSSISNRSITNTQLSLDSDPVLKSTLGSEGGLDKWSIFHDKTFGGDTSDKNFQGNDLFTPGGEKARTYTERKIVSTLSKEDKLSSPSHFKDSTKESKLFSDYDLQNQEDGPRRRKELKIDRSKNDMYIDLKLDEEEKESKALRHFRTALIDFVKELVKPKWREGHLSKDAHKIIVKRTVEKVLSTLQTQQTTGTEESIKQFLSASEQKISKLVEAYIFKYGKS